MEIMEILLVIKILEIIKSIEFMVFIVSMETIKTMEIVESMEITVCLRGPCKHNARTATCQMAFLRSVRLNTSGIS